MAMIAVGLGKEKLMNWLLRDQKGVENVGNSLDAEP
jgi:hypothetical protein